MAVMVRFECGQEDRQREPMGPYEWVQMTYELLRVSPDGEEIGWFEDDVWKVKGEKGWYSDVVIG